MNILQFTYMNYKIIKGYIFIILSKHKLQKTFSIFILDVNMIKFKYRSLKIM